MFACGRVLRLHALVYRGLSRNWFITSLCASSPEAFSLHAWDPCLPAQNHTPPPPPPPQKHWRWRVVGADWGVTRAFKSVVKCALCWKSKNAHSDPHFSFSLLRRQPEQILKCHGLWTVLPPESFQKRRGRVRWGLLIMLGWPTKTLNRFSGGFLKKYCNMEVKEAPYSLFYRWYDYLGAAQLVSLLQLTEVCPLPSKMYYIVQILALYIIIFHAHVWPYKFLFETTNCLQIMFFRCL